MPMSTMEAGKYTELMQKALTMAFQFRDRWLALRFLCEAGCHLNNILHQRCKCFARQGLVSQNQKQNLKSNGEKKMILWIYNASYLQQKS